MSAIPLRTFGWTGEKVPVLGQGTWMIEGSAAEEDLAVEALRTGIDAGLTHIDTAEMYGSGRAERIVARAIAGCREKIFLTSKVLPSNASYEGTLRACEASLKRLGTDHLDLYLLHWESRYPIAETMRALEKLAEDGRTRYIGVSNFDVAQVREAEHALRHGRLACNQVLYHLGDRGIERRLLPYCEERGIAVVGYSPFGSRGGFPALHRPAGRVLADVAQRHGLTPHQAVLQFLARGSVFPIPKSATPARTPRERRGTGTAVERRGHGRHRPRLPRARPRRPARHDLTAAPGRATMGMPMGRILADLGYVVCWWLAAGVAVAATSDATARTVVETRFHSPFTPERNLERLDDYYQVQVGAPWREALGEIAPGRYFESWRDIWIALTPEGTGTGVNLRSPAEAAVVDAAKRNMLELAGQLAAEGTLEFRERAPAAHGDHGGLCGT